MLRKFRKRPLLPGAFADRPLNFMSLAELEDLANITAVDLIENGDRAAREHWQNKQLTNLLRHAQARSAFWRQRMPPRAIGHGIMHDLPIQSREDVVAQVSLEGCLAATDGVASMVYASSGSTGTPVNVFYSPQNAYYNTVRYLAQYFIYGLSLEENHVRIRNATDLGMLERRATRVKSDDAWAGPLARIFRNGASKQITHAYDDDTLIDELSKDPVGYLNCQSRFVEIILKRGGVDLVKRLGIKLWVHFSDYRDPDVVKALAGIGVPSLSNYSASEIGPIGFECPKFPGNYHVTHSNVIVELDDKTTTTFNGATLGRLLVTHLHSYATPLIRYDIGDFGQLEKRCPCGHDGATISRIFGRGKHFLRHPNGKLLPFYIKTEALLDVFPTLTECRFTQKEIDTITVEIGGPRSITAKEEGQLKKLIVIATDPVFKIRIEQVDKIDWSGNPKRLIFASSVA
jgi:phenylacetate-coenzyme A ligase PaaK-like adenylate-forming protein